MSLDLVWSMGLDDSAFKRSLDQSITNVSKAASAMNAIWAGARAIGALKAGFELASGAAKAFRTGDLDPLVDSLERLPFGIGSVVGSLKFLVGELSGINAELDALKAHDQEMLREQQRLNAQIAEHAVWKNLVREMELREQLDAAADEYERKRLQAVQDHGRAMERALEQARKAGVNTANSPDFDRYARQAADQYERAARRAEEERREAARRDAERAQAEAESRRRAEVEAAMDREGLEVERLRLEGKRREADLLENELRLRRELENLRRAEGLSPQERAGFEAALRRNAELRRRAIESPEEGRGSLRDLGPGLSTGGGGLVGLARQVFAGGNEAARRNAERARHEKQVESLLSGLKRSMEGVDRFIDKYQLNPGAGGGVFAP